MESKPVMAAIIKIMYFLRKSVKPITTLVINGRLCESRSRAEVSLGMTIMVITNKTMVKVIKTKAG